MNRETKRMMQRQGQVGEDGAVAVRQPTPPPRRPPDQRVPFIDLRETRDELRKVAWPNRSEVINYSTVVFVTLVLLIGLIFALNYGASKAVLYLLHS
ncbi:MAG: preprotein translocase subunit SecE [Actinobacteria bacterium]|nr:preprotein translocase subunit SecE [Actinomycetota bacterium]